MPKHTLCHKTNATKYVLELDVDTCGVGTMAIAADNLTTIQQRFINNSPSILTSLNDDIWVLNDKIEMTTLQLRKIAKDIHGSIVIIESIRQQTPSKRFDVIGVSCLRLMKHYTIAVLDHTVPRSIDGWWDIFCSKIKSLADDDKAVYVMHSLAGDFRVLDYQTSKVLKNWDNRDDSFIMLGPSASLAELVCGDNGGNQFIIESATITYPNRVAYVVLMRRNNLSKVATMKILGNSEPQLVKPNPKNPHLYTVINPLVLADSTSIQFKNALATFPPMTKDTYMAEMKIRCDPTLMESVDMEDRATMKLQYLRMILQGAEKTAKRK